MVSGGVRNSSDVVCVVLLCCSIYISIVIVLLDRNMMFYMSDIYSVGVLI